MIGLYYLQRIKQHQSRADPQIREVKKKKKTFELAPKASIEKKLQYVHVNML